MKYFVLVLALLCTVTNAAAQRSSVVKGDSVVVPNAQPLRDLPNSTGDVISQIPSGTVLVVTGAKGQYYKVVYQDKAGYLFKNFVYPVAKYRKMQERERRTREAELEAERQRDQVIAEARMHKATARDKGLDLYLLKHVLRVNSVGGVTPKFNVENLGDKVIKYLYISLIPYNAVGDVVRGQISGKSQFTLTGVGPIEPRKTAFYEFDNAWYNGTTDCVEVRKIVVEYMDGSRFTYVNDLQHIRATGANVRLQGECKV